MYLSLIHNSCLLELEARNESSSYEWMNGIHLLTWIIYTLHFFPLSSSAGIFSIFSACNWSLHLVCFWTVLCMVANNNLVQDLQDTTYQTFGGLHAVEQNFHHCSIHNHNCAM